MDIRHITTHFNIQGLSRQLLLHAQLSFSLSYHRATFGGKCLEIRPLPHPHPPPPIPVGITWGDSEKFSESNKSYTRWTPQGR